MHGLQLSLMNNDDDDDDDYYYYYFFFFFKLIAESAKTHLLNHGIAQQKSLKINIIFTGGN